MNKNNIHIIFLFFFLVFLNSCSSFSYEKKITGKYFLIGVDAQDYLNISRKLSNGDYIGRVPANVLEYKIIDSFIVAKSEEKGAFRYYIVNMQKDSDYAQESDFLIGPLNYKEFIKYCGENLAILQRQSHFDFFK